MTSFTSATEESGTVTAHGLPSVRACLPPCSRTGSLSNTLNSMLSLNRGWHALVWCFLLPRSSFLHASTIGTLARSNVRILPIPPPHVRSLVLVPACVARPLLCCTLLVIHPSMYTSVHVGSQRHYATASVTVRTTLSTVKTRPGRP